MSSNVTARKGFLGVLLTHASNCWMKLSTTRLFDHSAVKRVRRFLQGRHFAGPFHKQIELAPAHPMATTGTPSARHSGWFQLLVIQALVFLTVEGDATQGQRAQ